MSLHKPNTDMTLLKLYIFHIFINLKPEDKVSAINFYYDEARKIDLEASEMVIINGNEERINKFGDREDFETIKDIDFSLDNQDFVTSIKSEFEYATFLPLEKEMGDLEQEKDKVKVKKYQK